MSNGSFQQDFFSQKPLKIINLFLVKMGSEQNVQSYFQVNLRGHCLFCLQPHSLQDFSPSYWKNIHPLQLLVNCTNKTTGMTGSVEERTTESFQNLPPVCLSCFANFEKLQHLYEQLRSVQELVRNQMEVIREVVYGAVPKLTDSSKSKWTSFEKRARSYGHKEEHLTMTFALVRNLQRLILGEVENGDNKTAYFSKYGPDVEFCETHSSPTVQTIIKMESIENEEDFGSERIESDALDMCTSPGPDQQTSSQVLKSYIQNLKCSDNDSDQFSEDDKKNLEWKIEIPKHGSNKKRGRPRKRKKAKVVKGPKKIRKEKTVPALQHQSCDLCGVKVPIEGILEHVQEHVKSYATKCPNVSCPCVFSCQLKMLRHLKESRRCKRVSPVVSTREAAGVSGKCEVCSLRCKTAWHLRTHLKIHETEMAGTTGASRKECPISGCNEAFYINQNIQYHLFRHDLRSTTIKTQSCSLCSESIELPEMENHLRGSHGVTEFYKCNYCSFLFDNADDKIVHVFTHRNLNGVVCDICNDGIKLTPLVFLRRHYFNTHQLGTSTSVVCQYCGKEYLSPLALQIHERKAHSDIVAPPSSTKTPSKIFQCDLCPDKFGSSGAVTAHKIKAHGTGYLPCSLCSCTFRSENLLKMHWREHAGTAPIYKCKVAGCEKEFKYRAQLSRHEEICQLGEGERPHACDMCEKSFKRKIGLKRHKNEVHLGIRPTLRVCEECGESFARSEFLKAHKLIHTGEMPYSCKTCGQAFRHSSTLWKHERSHQEKGESFKPHGPMKSTRKRVQR